MRNRYAKIGVSLLAALSLMVSASLALAKMPRNVILMISDGQGYNTVKATDYWAGRSSVYENFPVQYGMSTFSAGLPGKPSIGYDPALAWADFNYVKTGATDSASASTAIATGVKIYDNVIGKDINGNNLKTIVEIASDLGKATGVVTTVEISHATPAGMVAHNVSRYNYEQLASEMLSSSGLDVIMGAGHPTYDNSGNYRFNNYQYVGGVDTWNALKAGTLNGWYLIEDKAAFEALATTASPPQKVVGVVQAFETTQQKRQGKPADAVNPSGMAFNSNVPSLATMTQGALNILAKNSEGQAKGFFLMVEGGAVDWANHAKQVDRMIEEQMDFNASVQAVVDWVKANGGWDDTLLIVTADHECGHVWGPTLGTFNPVVNNGAGVLPGATHHYGDHTNALVPLYAIGAGAALFNCYADRYDPVRGLYVDNTEVLRVMNGSPVPIPGAEWLLGSGLVRLSLFCRKKPLSSINPLPNFHSQDRPRGLPCFLNFFLYGDGEYLIFRTGRKRPA